MTSPVTVQNSIFSAFMFYIICGQFLSDTNDKIKSKGTLQMYVIITSAMPLFYNLTRSSFPFATRNALGVVW